MRFLIATPNKKFLKTLTGVFRHTTCNNVWVISDMDLYDHTERRKLPDGTIWVRPGSDNQAYVTNLAGETVISVPLGHTFQSFQIALNLLESVKAYRHVDWVAVSPFGSPEPNTAYAMRNAYVDFTFVLNKVY